MDRGDRSASGLQGLPDFVEPFPYICEHCVLFMINPYQTQCGHRLCKPCLERHLLEHGDPAPCPFAEEDCEKMSFVNERFMVYPDFSLKRSVTRTIVYCPNRSRGCAETMAWKDLQKHLEDCPCQEHDGTSSLPVAVTGPASRRSIVLSCNYEKMGCAFVGTADELGEHLQRADAWHHDLTRKRVEEMELRFQLLETSSYNGVLLWKINNYRRRKAAAEAGRALSQPSPPFFTSRQGYRMCARVYLNGDGVGLGSHLSLFFYVMRGNNDVLLRWPFRKQVTIALVDKKGTGRHIKETFIPDPSSSSFPRPPTSMNIASRCPLNEGQEILNTHLPTVPVQEPPAQGPVDRRLVAEAPMFVSHQLLEEEGSPYLLDDEIFIKIKVDMSDPDSDEDALN